MASGDSTGLVNYIHQSSKFVLQLEHLARPQFFICTNRARSCVACIRADSQNVDNMVERLDGTECFI